MNHHFSRVLPGIGLLVTLSSCAYLATQSNPVPQGSTAYINGNIYTANSQQPLADTLIVEQGKFAYVGKLEQFSGELDDYRVIDLQGKTLVPGLYDSHIHPIGAGEKLLFECSFSQQASLEDIVAAVAKCSETIPQGSWITGGSWSAELMEQLDRSLLDQVSKGRPVVLYDFSHHNIWANSAAMNLAGVNRNNTAKYKELAIKDSQGRLTGVFLEQAGSPIISKIPRRNASEYKQAAKKAIDVLNSYGIVGVKDSYVYTSEYNVWFDLEQEQQLTANVAVSWGWPSDKTLNLRQKQQKFQAMVQPDTTHIKTAFTKLSLDGIPPTKTAAMLEPYLPENQRKFGSLNYSQTELNETLQWLDQQGYTAQIHAVGDRAARSVLDAVDYVRATNGDSGLRHDIAHACIVNPQDIPRFAELKVVPNFSPIFWYPSPIQDGLEALLGQQRAKRNCAMKSLAESNAFPTGGSDWPVSVDVNPWKAMESMVTRKDPNGLRPDQVLWPEQQITIEQALQFYTLNGAMALKLEASHGSIQKGKSADFLILDRNVFTIASDQIGETQVLQTIFEGKTVYQPQ